MIRPSARTILAAGVVFLLGVRAARAQTAADLESARDLFKQANDLRDAGDLKGALVKYKAAHALGNTPATGLELGRAYVDSGLLVEGRETLLAIDNIPKKPNESERTKTARAEASKLVATLHDRIPSLTVVVDGAANVTPTVTIDGVAIPAAAIGVERKINPGDHVIVVSVSGREATTNVSLAERDSRTVHVEAPAPPLEVPVVTPVTPVTTPEAPPIVTPAPITSSPTIEWHPRQPSSETSVPASAWVVGSLGLASWSVMAITGGLAISKKGDVTSHCNQYKQCDPVGLAAASSGNTLATVATVTSIIGAVGIAGAIVIGVVGSHKHGSNAALLLSPSQGGGSLRLEGSF
jgi:hypothetical protein